MLIDEASEGLGEQVLGGAVLETSDTPWLITLASEIGFIPFLIAGVVSVATKPFRSTKPKFPNPFLPHQGTVYLAITETRAVFFALTVNSSALQINEILAEHTRSSGIAIMRTGRTVSFQVEPETTYQIFWRDTQTAWLHVEGILNSGRSPYWPSQET